ncbi:prepilin peptidase [Paenibacillus anaericanus]|uniref:prepilin peptidase n=1 Tax=Paenibacillus anaericanus TaxID=170367 RepID=UPI001476977C|nr:A24 family peptidase [Paenibacillus anaericanus]
MSYVVVVLLIFAIRDIRTQILPDRWILAAFAGSLVIRVIYSPGSIFNYIGAALCVGGIIIIIALISNGGIGGGDVKLLTWLGFSVGLYPTLMVLLISCVFGLTYVAIWKRGTIPFAPFVFLSFMVCEIVKI